MIAVTSSREWVAVPPSHDVFKRPHTSGGEDYERATPAERLDGTVVAVVEEDHLYRSLDPVLGTLVTDRFTLTGFAKVAEVVSIFDAAGDLSEGHPAMIQMDRPGRALYWPEGCADFEDGTQNITLPHASPGGLALRLEPLMDNDHCPICGGTIGCQDLERTCDRIGEPVTVVGLVGEIGRWER